MADPTYAYFDHAENGLKEWLTARLARRLVKDEAKRVEWDRLLTQLQKEALSSNRKQLSSRFTDSNDCLDPVCETGPQAFATLQTIDIEQQHLCDQLDEDAVKCRTRLFLSIPAGGIPLTLLHQFVVSTQGFAAADASIMANVVTLQILYSKLDGGGFSKPSRAAAAPVREALPHSPIRAAPSPPHCGAGVASTLPTPTTIPTVGDVYRELSGHLIPRLWLGDGWHNAKKTVAPPSDEPLCRGATSRIHYGTLRGQEIVLKEFILHQNPLLQLDDATIAIDQMIVVFRNEARILAQAGMRCREGVVQLHGYIIGGASNSGDDDDVPLGSCSLVMSRLKPLAEEMKSLPPLSESYRVSILVDIAHALDVLHHSRNSGSGGAAAAAAEAPAAASQLGGDGPIIHCDIKPENILIQRNSYGAPFRALIADFGVSHCIGDRRQNDTNDNHSLIAFSHTRRHGYTAGFADHQLVDFHIGRGINDAPCRESDVFAFGWTAACVLLWWPKSVKSNAGLNELKDQWDDSTADSPPGHWRDGASWASLKVLVNRCVLRDRVGRPSMKSVAEDLRCILRKLQAAEAAARGSSASAATRGSFNADFERGSSAFLGSPATSSSRGSSVADTVLGSPIGAAAHGSSLSGTTLSDDGSVSCHPATATSMSDNGSMASATAWKQQRPAQHQQQHNASFNNVAVMSPSITNLAVEGIAGQCATISWTLVQGTTAPNLTVTGYKVGVTASPTRDRYGTLAAAGYDAATTTLFSGGGGRASFSSLSPHGTPYYFQVIPIMGHSGITGPPSSVLSLVAGVSLWVSTPVASNIASGRATLSWTVVGDADPHPTTPFGVNGNGTGDLMEDGLTLRYVGFEVKGIIAFRSSRGSAVSGGGSVEMHGLTPGRTYFYQVTAFNAAQVPSAPSGIVSFVAA